MRYDQTLTMSFHSTFHSIVFLAAIYLMGIVHVGLNSGNPHLSKVQSHSFQQNEYIKIGLLVPKDIKKDSLSLEAFDAVSMAAEKVNSSGGINDQKIRIVTRACDGNWGAGSKQAVNLVYDEKVCAIIGSLDGRNAHLAEQVATKAQVIFMSTRATDPTLAQINIPWFFRIMPEDIQQAEELIKEIYQKRKLDRICIIATDSYDDNMAVKTFTDVTAKHKYQLPEKYIYDSKYDFEDLTGKIIKSKYDGIVFFGDGQHLTSLISELKIKNINIPIFSTLSSMVKVAHQDFLALCSNYDLNFICSKNWFDTKGNDFRKQFENLYNYEPGIIAAYSFDGFNALIQAIRQSGYHSSKIRAQLTMMNPTGIMGPIKFKSNGNCERQDYVCHMVNGRISIE